MGAPGSEVCLACGAPTLRPWRAVRSFDRRSAKPAYLLRRCHCCGTAVTEGRAADEAARLHRGGAYAAPPDGVDRLLEPLRWFGERATLAAVGDVARGATVLDLGAGDGRMLDLFRRRGCVVAGVEPFAPRVRAGVGIRRTTLEDAEVEPESADVVLLWHVLEHLGDPARALSVASRGMRATGRVVISVPRLDSLQARLGGDCWFHLDVPRHAIHFSRTGMIRLVERCGLRVARIGNVVIDQNLLGMTQTLLNRLTSERNVAFRALKGDRDGVAQRDLVVSALAAGPVALGGSLLEAAAMLAGRGGAIVVHAVRSAS